MLHLHLQHRTKGVARRRKGEATNRSRPKPANIPTTWREDEEGRERERGRETGRAKEREGDSESVKRRRGAAYP